MWNDFMNPKTYTTEAYSMLYKQPKIKVTLFFPQLFYFFNILTK